MQIVFLPEEAGYSGVSEAQLLFKNVLKFHDGKGCCFKIQNSCLLSGAPSFFAKEETHIVLFFPYLVFPETECHVTQAGSSSLCT